MSLVIKQVKSSNGADGKQRDTLRSLGLRGIGKTVERRGLPAAARHGPRVRHSSRSRRSNEPPRWHRGAVRREDRASHRPPQPQAGPRLARRPRKRVGRGEGSGTGKTAGRGQKGYGSRAGRQGPRALRGWPEPDPHADAQAARPEQEDVDAVRAVPHAHPAGQPATTWRRASTTAPTVDLEALRAAGLGHAQGRAGQDARPGRADEEADRPRPRVLARPPARASRPRAGPARSSS